MSSPIIIFGNKHEKFENKIFVNEKDFQSVLANYQTTKKTMDEIFRIENSLINNKPVLEYFQYDDGPSFWWFMHTQISDNLNNIISFIENFKNFLLKTKPSLVQITNNYKFFEIIKQICNQNNISFKYSKLEYTKFKFAQKNKILVKNIGISVFTQRKIASRQKLFQKMKGSVIPEINNKLLFLLSQTYRQDIYFPKQDITKRGEHLVSRLGELINDYKIVYLDFLSILEHDDSILNERLSSDIDCFPIDMLLHKPNSTKYNYYLEKYDNLLKNVDFQNLFSYQGIKLWSSIEESFQKMKTAPYIPYWLLLLDSLLEYFSKNKPKAIFIPYETGPIAQIIIFVANYHKIRSIGIQHGIIHDHHPSYSKKIFYDHNHPYGFLFPNFMLLFGEITKNQLVHYNYPEQNLVTFGNTTFFNLNKTLNNFSKHNLHEKYKIDQSKKIILLLPPAIIKKYESSEDHNYNTQIWKTLIESFSNSDKLIVILKPHPRDDISFYKNILDKYNKKNIKIIQGNLLELIYVSTLVVSSYSNSIMDALAMNKPVIQIIFENLETHMPNDGYDAVQKTNLSQLSKVVDNLLSNSADIEKLLKNAQIFVKSYYNIPEENPAQIIRDLLK